MDYMLLQLTPSNWFFIFLALLLSSYLKIASVKSQKPYSDHAIVATSLFR